VPEADEPWLIEAAHEMLEAEVDPDKRDGTRRAEISASIKSLFARIVAQERRNPSGGLLSDLVQVEENGDRLSPDELLAMAEIVVIAGVETTQRLIASLVFGLLRYPAQLQTLLSDPSLLKFAVEEALRFYPPNQFRMRYVASDLTLHGTALKPGTKLFAFIGGANRDPRTWRSAEEFEIKRFADPAAPAHLSFGWGPHYCVGAYLSRVETIHALETLLGRLTNLRLDAAHEVRFSGFRNRSPSALHVRFEPIQH
jgi:pimeloyl-[acyl-carrier protein] synthase